MAECEDRCTRSSTFREQQVPTSAGHMLANPEPSLGVQAREKRRKRMRASTATAEEKWGI